MAGPRRRDRRTAPSRNPVEVRRLLQRDADTFIAVERRTQASSESGQSGEGAARRWTASRIPAAGGMRPIGRIVEGTGAAGDRGGVAPAGVQAGTARAEAGRG